MPFATTTHLNIRAWRESDKTLWFRHENDYRVRRTGNAGYVVPVAEIKWKNFEEEHLPNMLLCVVIEVKREYAHLRKWDEGEVQKKDEEKTQEDWDSELFAGQASMNVRMPKNRDGSLGLGLSRQWWGNGFATEVVEWITMHCFEQLGLHRASLGLFSNNPAAKRVYEKCGFVHEGVTRKAFWMDGGWIDEFRMGMLEEEYWARKKQLAGKA